MSGSDDKVSSTTNSTSAKLNPPRSETDSSVNTSAKTNNKQSDSGPFDKKQHRSSLSQQQQALKQSLLPSDIDDTPQSSLGFISSRARKLLALLRRGRFQEAEKSLNANSASDEDTQRVATVLSYLVQPFWSPLLPRFRALYLDETIRSCSVPPALAEELASSLVRVAAAEKNSGHDLGAISVLDVVASLVSRAPEISPEPLEGHTIRHVGISPGTFQVAWAEMALALRQKLELSRRVRLGLRLASFEKCIRSIGFDLVANRLLEHKHNLETDKQDSVVECIVPDVQNVDADKDRDKRLALIDMASVMASYGFEFEQAAMVFVDAVENEDSIDGKALRSRLRQELDESRARHHQIPRDVMRDFLQGAAMLRCGRISDAMSSLASCLKVFPNSALFLRKAVQARLSHDISEVARLAEALADSASDNAAIAMPLYTVALDVLKRLQPFAAAASATDRITKSLKQVEGSSQLQALIQARSLLNQGKLRAALDAFATSDSARRSEEAVTAIDTIRSVLATSKLDADDPEALLLLRKAREAMPYVECFHNKLRKRMLAYTKAVEVRVYKKHAVEELSGNNAKFALLLIQKMRWRDHVKRQLCDESLPFVERGNANIEDDGGELAYRRLLRATRLKYRADLLLRGSTPPVEAIEQAADLYTEADNIAGSDWEGFGERARKCKLDAISRREGVATLVVEAGKALDSGRILRARSLYARASAANPRDTSLRAQERDIDLVLARRHRARRELVAGLKILRGGDGGREAAARHLHRAASMLTNCRAYQHAAAQADALVSGVGNAEKVKVLAGKLMRERRWLEAKSLLDEAVKAAPTHKQMLRRQAQVAAVLEEEEYGISAQVHNEQGLSDDQHDVRRPFRREDSLPAQNTEQ